MKKGIITIIILVLLPVAHAAAVSESAVRALFTNHEPGLVVCLDTLSDGGDSPGRSCHFVNNKPHFSGDLGTEDNAYSTIAFNEPVDVLFYSEPDYTGAVLEIVYVGEGKPDC